MASKRSGGINIQDSAVNIGGDAVGRDKFEDHQHFNLTARDEKGGFVLFIERFFAFVFGLLIGGLVLGVMGGLVGSVFDAPEVGAGIGAVLAVGFAIAAASNVSRFREPK